MVERCRKKKLSSIIACALTLIMMGIAVACSIARHIRARKLRESEATKSQTNYLTTNENDTQAQIDLSTQSWQPPLEPIVQ